MKKDDSIESLHTLLFHLDRYSTVSAHNQKHHKGMWRDVCRSYAKYGGISIKAADQVLKDVIL